MNVVRWILLLFSINGSVFAEDVKFVGGVEKTITVFGKGSRLFKAAPLVKRITLMRFELSEKAWQTIDHRMTIASLPEAVAEQNPYPVAVQLGMGNVPVLDQGKHGSCVIFANTAVVDAILNKGDYVSQLCLLQLGHYLEKNTYRVSGWDGSLGGSVLNEMAVFGLVSKEQQRINGCGGVTEYPALADEPDTEMSALEYHQISEPLDEALIGWSQLLDPYQVTIDQFPMNLTLNQVKAALNEGDRLTVGVLLSRVYDGVVGAVGRHVVSYDSWVLTPEIEHDIQLERGLFGHELVITGYDDNASAVDEHGRVHQGLLTLRNSWGTLVGDKGDFYMSYDYFKAFAVEVIRLRLIHSIF